MNKNICKDLKIVIPFCALVKDVKGYMLEV